MEPRLELTKDGNYSSPDDPGEAGYPGNPRRRSVTPEEADILAALAKGLRVLEIGTGLGVSTRAMAATAKGVYSVDTDEWCHGFEFPENVELASTLPFDKDGFDMVFIDGHHGYESVLKDIADTAPIKIVVLHDYYLPGVKRAVQDSGLTVVRTYDTRCEVTICTR